jgi:hypothetical protein
MVTGTKGRGCGGRHKGEEKNGALKDGYSIYFVVKGGLRACDHALPRRVPACFLPPPPFSFLFSLPPMPLPQFPSSNLLIVPACRIQTAAPRPAAYDGVFLVILK